MDDHELVELAKAGNKEAFRQLLDNYARITGRVAYILLADKRDAEDAAQEAWLDVWRGLPGFDPARPFRPWLLTVVTNRCRMKARHRQPLTTYVPEIDQEMPDATLPYPSDSYDEELDVALRQLDENQRRIILLRFYGDLQLSEIADLTGVPLSTVKSRLYRALMTLRAQLQESHTKR